MHEVRWLLGSGFVGLFRVKSRLEARIAAWSLVGALLSLPLSAAADAPDGGKAADSPKTAKGAAPAKLDRRGASRSAIVLKSKNVAPDRASRELKLAGASAADA